MEIGLDILSWICIAGGSVFCISGGLGLVRLPDFYSRTHASGMTDTLGAGLILGGLLFQSESWEVGVRLILVVLFLLFTTPTSAHALARAAFTRGLPPILHDQQFDSTLTEGDIPIEGTNPVEDNA